MNMYSEFFRYSTPVMGCKHWQLIPPRPTESPPVRDDMKKCSLFDWHVQYAKPRLIQIPTRTHPFFGPKKWPPQIFGCTRTINSTWLSMADTKDFALPPHSQLSADFTFSSHLREPSHQQTNKHGQVEADGPQFPWILHVFWITFPYQSITRVGGVFHAQLEIYRAKNGQECAIEGLTPSIGFRKETRTGHQSKHAAGCSRTPRHPSWLARPAQITKNQI